ncbi:hypothetical protein MY1884_006662 [Beauveria asiatica]
MHSIREKAPARDRRRRIAKACDPCRLKKVKCNGVRPACARCQQLDAPCRYADVMKGPYRRAGRIYERTRLEIKAFYSDEQVISVGPSTSLSSVFTKTDRSSGNLSEESTSFNTITTSLRSGPFTGWTHSSMRSVFCRRVHGPLPSWDEALSLVNDFFAYENRYLPLFDHPTFLTLLGRQYSDDPPPESSWWASLNIVLATAERRRAATDAVDCQRYRDRAWNHASNAMQVLLDVLLHHISLLSVQALVALGRFFLGVPNPQPSFIMSSSAVRLAQAIGLHKQDCDSSPLGGPAQARQRARVFWCVKILDQGVCFRTGRPSAQKPDDYTVTIPSSAEGDGSSGSCRSLDGQVCVDILRLNASFSIIEADAFQALYPAASSAKTSLGTGQIVANLEKRLQQWLVAIPPAARPPNLVESNWEESAWPHLCRLHLQYFASLISIYRAEDMCTFWDLSEPLSTHAVSPSVQKCVCAARSLVPLLWEAPENRYSFYWDVLGIAASALFVLHMYINRLPNGEGAKQDFELMQSIVRLLHIQVREGADPFSQQLLIASEAACKSTEMTLGSSQSDITLEEETPDIPLESFDLDLAQHQLLCYPWSSMVGDANLNIDADFSALYMDYLSTPI